MNNTNTLAPTGAFQLLALKGALKLEIAGMHHSSGKRASVTIRALLAQSGKPAPRALPALLVQWETHLIALGALVSDAGKLDPQIANVEREAAHDPHCGFYFVTPDNARVIGANGRETAITQPGNGRELSTVPKFATFATIRTFARWAGITNREWRITSLIRA